LRWAQVHTELPESSIAPFLTTLQERVKKEMIVRTLPCAAKPLARVDELIPCLPTQRVGSYPKLHFGVDVSLIGKDQARLKELAEEGTAGSLRRERLSGG
jgi:hypothetical protein